MSRRRFLASLLLTPAALAYAQTPARVGVFLPNVPIPPAEGPEPRNPAVAALLLGMRDQGQVFGRSFVTEVKGGQASAAQYEQLAAELVATKPAVIVAPGFALHAIQRVTTTVPVVMAAGGDPVADGFAASLARPGGNFTGLGLQFAETMGKRVEILREAVRGSGPLVVMSEAAASGLPQAAAESARSIGWTTKVIDLSSAADIEPAFRAAAGAAAVLIVPGGLVDRHQAEVVALAAKHRLPAMYGFRRFVEAGGLMSYNADIVAIWRRAGWYVDRILNGARPGELAIEQPTKYDLVVNRNTAKELGLDLAPLLRARGAEVI
jgi:putative ABC transport system substrate-binding protein